MTGDRRRKKTMAQTQHDLMIRVLEAAGGRSIEAVAPAGYTGKMADILFPDEDVIVEVKTLTTDRASEAKTMAAVKAMFAENRELGAPDPEMTASFRLHDLPEIIAIKVLRIVGQRVQTEVRDANRQIKATKTGLDRHDALGLIALVTPPFTLDRNSIVWLVKDAVREDRFGSVDSILLVETPLGAPVDMQGRKTSFLSTHSRGGKTLSEPLARAIGDAWGRVTGQDGRYADGDDFHLYGATS